MATVCTEESVPVVLGKGEAEASMDSGQRGGGPWVGGGPCKPGGDMGEDNGGKEPGCQNPGFRCMKAQSPAGYPCPLEPVDSPGLALKPSVK